MSKQITKAGLAQEVATLIAQGIECWNKAGELVVRLLDEQGFTIEDIASKSDFLTEDLVRKFEQLGRKLVMPELLVAGYPAARCLMKLPFSEQQRITESGVDVLILKDGNKTETLKVSAENLQPQQCRQVFAGDVVRNLPAQRAYLEEKAAAARLAAPIEEMQDLYRVRGSKVIFTRACEMNRGQLARILVELEQ